MRKKVLDDGRRSFIGASILAVAGAAVVSTGLLVSGNGSAQNKSAGRDLNDPPTEETVSKLA